MNKYLLFNIFVIISQLGFGQDTVKVQTLIWSDAVRNGVYNFPTGNDSYRKIIMRYNMRCHGARVSSGGNYNGCREWDYSCNTFLTDSTRVDSFLAERLQYDVRSFAGKDFPFMFVPGYTIQKFPFQNTTLTLTSNLKEVSNGPATNSFTLPAGKNNGRLQYLIPASQMTSWGLPGNKVEQMKLNAISGSGMMKLCKVRMKNLATGEYSSSSFNEATLDVVYFNNVRINGSGNINLPFLIPFVWNGTSDVLVDISFQWISTTGATLGSINSTGPNFKAQLASDYALESNGQDGFALPNNNFNSISNEITMAFWAYGNPQKLPTNNSVLEGTDQFNNRQVNVHLPWSDNAVYWDCGNDGTGYDRVTVTLTNPSEYKGWHFWAFTKNAATGTMSIYRDGLLIRTVGGLRKPIILNALTFGGGSRDAHPYFGVVNDFTLWNKELNLADIKNLMFANINANIPNYSSLVGYYPMDDASGRTVTQKFPSASPKGNFVGASSWYLLQGEDLRNINSSINTMPVLTLTGGTFQRTNVTVEFRDSMVRSAVPVTEYGLNGTNLVVVDNYLWYEARNRIVNSDWGSENLEDLIAEGITGQDKIKYQNKIPAKYELMSLVTPYGGGINLTDKGKTFYFDVTDFAPILKGRKRLSLEMGGEFQEEMDIQFWFIKGTPPEPVLDIQNVWPFRRGSFSDILTDKVFEAKAMNTLPNGRRFKYRSVITGHEQNGEFIRRNHFVRFENQKIDFDVWEECGFNPIYPQGGTWIYDRAGWCPGMPSQLNEFDITNRVTPGQKVNLDYGLNGANLASANYLVSSNLITYGTPSFNLDASIEDVKRPNNQNVLYDRINPICTTPLITLKNDGTTRITSASFRYRAGGNWQTFDWTGSLASREKIDINLPISDGTFWTAGNTSFEISITKVNGANNDEYAPNNVFKTIYNPVDILSINNLNFYIKANNQAGDNSFTMKNAAGQVVLERQNLAANEIVSQTLNLPDGCYTLEVTDVSNDGLSFWAIPGNGSGSVAFRRPVTATIFTSVKNFGGDFGGGLNYEFVIRNPVSSEEPIVLQTVNAYPNPVSQELILDWFTSESTEINIKVFTTEGKLVNSQLVNSPQGAYKTTINTSDFKNGLYFIQIFDGRKSSYLKVFVQH
jgi:hypothetical protein